MVAVGAGPGVRVGVAPPGGSRECMAVPRVCLPPRGSRGCTADLCSGGASSSLVWRARGASSSPVRRPRTLR